MTSRPASRPPQEAAVGSVRRFDFRFHPSVRPVSRLFGVTPSRARVEISDADLTVVFGWWRLDTAVANVVDAEVTGPYAWHRIAGPPHLSLADRGITFATTTERGVCLRFAEPVPALVPTAALRHPGATITVEDVDGFIDALDV